MQSGAGEIDRPVMSVLAFGWFEVCKRALLLFLIMILV